MKVQLERVTSKNAWFSLLLMGWVLLCPELTRAAPGWVPVASLAPENIGPMLLLSDGTVMCKGASNTWLHLLPDQYGSYANGTWTNDIRPMHHERAQFASDVLPDGRVFVAGGEH